MGDASTIEWTDATWNPVRGCARVSEGCRNCYAERVAMRQSNPGGAYEGLVRMTTQGPKWTGEIRMVPQLLEQPVRWRKPRRIFVNSMSDLFHDDVDEGFINDVFAAMALAPQHVFQILTKRPRRMLDYISAGGRAAEVFNTVRNTEFGYWAGGEELPPQSWPLKNVWLGVSVEDQAAADGRIPLLLQTPAAVRWISAEPLLGRIDLGRRLEAPSLDWVVVGGESGPKARPAHPDWIRALRDQCVAFGTPFFFKQWGNWAPDHHYCDPDAEDAEEPCDCRSGRECHVTVRGHIHDDERDGQPPARTWTMRRKHKAAAGRMLDGREWNEYP